MDHANRTHQAASRHPGSPTPVRKDKGYTLVELVVVISLIGIILLVTVPSFLNYIKASSLAGAAGTLADDLHYARALANSQHTNYELRRTTGGYTLVKVATTTTVLSRTMPSGVTLTGTGTTTFYSWGLTQPATITLHRGSLSSVVALSAGGRVTRD